MSVRESSDADLIEVVLTDGLGAKEAFAELYRRYDGLVSAIARRILGPKSVDVDDAGQLVWTAVRESLSRIDTSRPIKPWICAVARNISLGVRRKRWRTNALHCSACDVAEGFQLETVVTPRDAEALVVDWREVIQVARALASRGERVPQLMLRHKGAVAAVAAEMGLKARIVQLRCKAARPVFYKVLIEGQALPDALAEFKRTSLRQRLREASE